MKKLLLVSLLVLGFCVPMFAFDGVLGLRYNPEEGLVPSVGFVVGHESYLYFDAYKVNFWDFVPEGPYQLDLGVGFPLLSNMKIIVGVVEQLDIQVDPLSVDFNPVLLAVGGSLDAGLGADVFLRGLFNPFNPDLVLIEAGFHIGLVKSIAALFGGVDG